MAGGLLGWLVLAIVWLTGALACWALFRPIVGLSGAGRSALPVVALLWPVFLVFAGIVGIIAAFDSWFDRRLDEVFGPDDREGDGA